MRDSYFRPPRPVDADRLLRPHNRVDLIIEVDNLAGQADIRSSMILEYDPFTIIVAQTYPPVGKALLGRKVEASVVHYDLVTKEPSRWGWATTIQSLDNKYKLSPDDPQTTAVIGLSPPTGRSALTRSNVRQAYRLEANADSGIAAATCPDLASVLLVNFSAGGLMLKTPAPTPYTLGQELAFELSFPPEAPLPIHRIEGQAVIVRLELDSSKRTAFLGLRIEGLAPAAQRALPKLLNHYMLEEQRQRQRQFPGLG